MRNRVVKDEAALCVVMESYLTDLKLDVYKEVSTPVGIIDIVAKQGPVLWAVEAKMTAGLGLLEQAESRLRFCHRVSVVTPLPPSTFFRQICREKGIGVFCVGQKSVYFRDRDPEEVACIEERVAPAFRRKVAGVKLYEAMRDTTAGLPSPLRVTPFTQTCDSIRRALAHKPEGMTLRELINGISHHYRTVSTAKVSLAKWMRSGVVAGVRYENGRAFLEEDAE